MTILNFNHKTTAAIPVDKVLDGAKGQVKDVFVIGWTDDGDLYVSSSTSDIADLNLMLDAAKNDLMDVFVNGN